MLKVNKLSETLNTGGKETYSMFDSNNNQRNKSDFPESGGCSQTQS